MLSTPSPSSPSVGSDPPSSRRTMTSDHFRASMETYWTEVRSFDQGEEGEEGGGEEEDERKSMDEVELEEAWLTEAGLSSLVSSTSTEEVPPPPEALLSTLSRQQVATVKRRLDKYNETLKTRNRQPIRDVRDVFTQFQPEDDSGERSPSPPSNHAESPQSRFHTTTKTIRRHTPRVRPALHMFMFEDQLPEHQETHSPTHSPTHTTNSPTHSPTHTTNSPTHSPTHSPSNTTTNSPTHSPSNTTTNSPTQMTTHSSTNSPTNVHSPSIPHWREADWLLRDSPYSEGVAEHKRGGACWDCLRFHGDDNSDLPFVPVSPSQGLTCADDLSSCDLQRLGFICHIELSTFLLALGVQNKRARPPRRRSRDSGVFAVPLTSLLESDRKKFPGVKVPVIFQKLLCILEQSGLQTEGILRVPASAARLKFLRKELDRCSVDVDWSSVRAVDAAALIKLFVRELPTPLLTHTHLSTYRSVLGVSSVVHQVQALQLLCLLLPEAHRDTLRALLVLLRKVVSHQDHNRMSLWNVSMVMAPNLFSWHHRGNKPSVTKQQDEMEEAVGGALLVRLMITHQDLLWTVPHFLMSQVRQVNQASNQKALILNKTKRRLLRRKNDKNHRDQITELCEGVIRVQAPLHTKVSMAIQLDGKTTARDVSARFKCDNSSPVQHLYEVGGNINERRLHPDCVLLDVYRVNPHCDWLIKP